MLINPDYELVDNPTALVRAAEILNSGHGAFAIDTERAGTYRYNDRAFLVQIYRQGAGTFLVAPEYFRNEASEILRPVLNNERWILHAASEDLPSLAELNLVPHEVFDTEMAARLLGYRRSNLAFLVDKVCDVTLEKGHGRDDWSQTPLPKSMLDYAALDVLYLHALQEYLGEQLREQEKTEIAKQEFDYLVFKRTRVHTPNESWLDIPQFPPNASPLERQLYKALWNARQHSAYDEDLAPPRILTEKNIAEIARRSPTSADQLLAIDDLSEFVRSDPHFWIETIQTAMNADKSTWPEPITIETSSTWTSLWFKQNDEPRALFQAVRDQLKSIAISLSIRPELLFTTRMLQEALSILYHYEYDWNKQIIRHALRRVEARPWQANIIMPVILRRGY